MIHSSLPHAARTAQTKSKTMLRTCAELWLAGVPIDWSRRYQGERRIKRVLPTYPFERRRYWIVDQQRATAQPSGRHGERPGGRGGRARRAGGTPNYFMETVTWRRVQYFNPPGASDQDGATALAGFQPNRKNRQADRGGAAATRRQSHDRREGRRNSKLTPTDGSRSIRPTKSISRSCARQ